MHTTKVQTKTHGEVLVLHNSDWSGMAVVHWKSDGETIQAALPGEMLVAMSRAAALTAVRSAVVDAIEGMKDGD